MNVNYDHYADCEVCEDQPIKKKSFFGKKPELAPLPKAGCPCDGYLSGCGTCEEMKQEGKTPMRYNDNFASATVISNAQSDTATQREFLLRQLSNAQSPKRNELQKLFNLYVDNTPKTYQAMIDIIKAGTYTIDKKVEALIEVDGKDDYYWGPLHGIIWPGPAQDHEGYEAAMKDAQVQYNKAQRIIMTGDAAAGLAALEAYEAWVPTPAVAS